MHNTPLSSRKHIVIYGNTNAGKSALFNAVLDQDAAIVSDRHGTTTDPVVKAMELIPYGPIALVDTAGLNDISTVGNLRIKRTSSMLSRTDLAVYAADYDDFDEQSFKNSIEQFKKKNIPYILVFTKIDTCNKNTLSSLKAKYPEAVFVSVKIKYTIKDLKTRISKELNKLIDSEDTIVGNLLDHGSYVVMCVPCDSEAPKGRLILPQVQLIRDCLDNGIICSVARETELAQCIENIKQIDLVVTDSQAFKLVNEIVPEYIMLTSFSMLLANQKGDITEMISGAAAIDNLKPEAKILISEACTHNSTHEDIGRVKLPKLIKQRTGIDFNYYYCVAHDFPENIAEYDMVIHCGGCMITPKEFKNRITQCFENGVPVTNYGVMLAYLNNILERCSRIFYKKQN